MRLLAFTILWLLAVSAQGVTYVTPTDFVARSFDTNPEPETLWLTPELQDAARQILGHPYRGLRIRYWHRDERSLWILDEIGKEKPITTGIVIDGNRVSNVVILAFRESRGGEVRHPFFTRQFDNLVLENDLSLSGNIDGITGATLSVNAVSNVTRFALYLHNSVLNSERVVASRSGDTDE